MATLMQALRCRKTNLALPGKSLKGVVWTERQPGETADPGIVDPAPPGHVLQLVWPPLPEDDEREVAELPQIDPAPLDPVPSAVRVFCVRDRRSRRSPTYAGSGWVPLARTKPGSISSRSWGRPCPTPAHAGGPQGVEGRGLSISRVGAGAAGDACKRQGPGCPF